MPNIGPLEIGIVLIIALIVFGPKRLPELGKSLGKGIKEFRGTIDGKHEPDEKPEVEQATPIAVAVRPLSEADTATRTHA
jgi:sec-independent protein translocase protein TatA